MDISGPMARDEAMSPYLMGGWKGSPLMQTCQGWKDRWKPEGRGSLVPKLAKWSASSFPLISACAFSH